MKIKPIKQSGIYDETRFNESITGTPTSVKSGVLDSDKKDYAVLSLYSIMYECGFVSKYLSEYKGKDLIEKLSNYAQELVDKFHSNESVNTETDYKVFDILTFNKGVYQIMDVIRQDGNIYLYLINDDKYKNDVAISKVENNAFTYIKSDEEFNFVINKLFLNSKSDIVDFLVDEE